MSTVQSLESYVQAAHAAVGLALAACREVQPTHDADAARAARVEAVTEKVRSVLAFGCMSLNELVSAARARRELVQAAVQSLLIRGEVGLVPGGYCLVPRLAA